MAVHKSQTKSGAKKLASRFRKKGFKATIFNPKGKGYSVSVTRKK